METALYRSLIAKTGTSSSEWLPLWMHLEDTAGVMKCLLEDFVSQSFAGSCGLEKELFEKTAVFAAYMHDIGKATVSFQYNIGKNLPERKQQLEYYNLCFPDFYIPDKLKQTPHSLAGEEIMLYLGCPEGIAAIVGSHHGIPADTSQIIDQKLNLPQRDNPGYENYYGNKKENCKLLQEVWEAILEKALAYSGFSDVSALPDIERPAQMLLTGLLIMADWIASNTEYLPLISVDEQPEYINYRARIKNAWEKICFPEMWRSCRSTYTDTDFEKTFGFLPSAVQRAVIDTVQNSDNPGIFIMEAPMGCGKTEAALASAEILAAKRSKKGVFFGLPTQATANGIFPRILKWGESQSEEIYHSVQLKHSSSQLNENFRKIQRGIPEEETDSGLIVHSWFCDGQKACLADFVTATVDQMLMTALKRKHVMLLHLGMSEKVVIIDEVHAYDAYMNQYLEMALRWLGAYNTPVILLSATLPSSRRMALIRAYLGLKRSDEAFEKETSYPLLTWTDGKEIKQKSLPYSGAKRTVKIITCTSSDIVPKIRQTVESGGCAGIIVNTVKRSQSFAEMLRKETNAEVMLYHAQFMLADRAEKEQILLERIGRSSSTEQRRGLVVVGTQVLEQSLDIDFDLLITDICPMDLLLQRTGRLHRHERPCRPESVKNPLCMVITDEAEDNSASMDIYGKWLLQETLARLKETITLPDDISPLVQAVYAASDGSKAYHEYMDRQNILKVRAGSFLLKKPEGTDIHCLLDRSIIDCEGEESVRDGISSVEVLLMQRTKDGTIRFLPGHYGGAAVSSFPNEEECIQIAEQKLRLPTAFCQNWSVKKTMDELENRCKNYIANWQKSHWLKDRLVLFLDEDLKGELLDFQLHYSFENGLEYQKKEGC